MKVSINLSVLFSYCIHYSQNRLFPLTVNMSRAIGIQCVFSVHLTLSTLFSSWCSTPYSGRNSVLSWLIGPYIVTERASDDQCLVYLDGTIFVAKLFRVRNELWSPTYLVASFLLLWALMHGASRWCIEQLIVILAQYRFIAIMQRICNCDIHNNT